ncbi:MAG TPA: bifunctional tetrahydrofolate synthase/dihydrofolate synthase [Methylophilaceae bacterium]
MPNFARFSSVTVPLGLPADLPGWLTYIEALHPKSIAMGLDRVDEVRQRLNLYPTFPLITVAGTNGKGSTCAMLERIYHEAGYRVGSYSSPHLLRYNERVRISCQEISDNELCSAFAAVETARQSTLLTYFEFGTLAAMCHFMQAGLDLAILEVGLGGRLDAVNIFDPDCTIVTSIDLDHMDFLGSSRESIGYEKAGIFRQGIAAICGDPDPPASLLRHAAETGADLSQIQQDFSFTTATDGTWAYVAGDTKIAQLPIPALRGAFQLYNAACVVTAVRVLQARLPISTDQIAAGLHNVSLAGRFQVCRQNPQVILDVAHNPHASDALAENLKQQPCKGRTFAVFAMLSDKDITGVINALQEEIDIWYVAGIEHPRGASADQLVELIHHQVPDNQLHKYPNVTSAFAQACIDAGENDRIVVFGSFFTVADIMRVLQAT